MIFKGNSAIDYLAEQIHKDDPGESSHWRMHHAKFSYVGTDFQGLYGFGGYTKPYRNLHLLAHNFFQAAYKNMATDKVLFKAIESVAKTIVSKQNRAYDLDVIRQALTLTLLKQKLPLALNGKDVVWVIGDGFASMTSLLLATKSAKRIVLVNLSKTLLVDLSYIKRWLGDEKFEESVALINSKEDIQALGTTVENDGIKIIAIQASDHQLLHYMEAGIVINIASMQEMDHRYIENYFDHMRKASQKNDVYFYCCNRTEKALPDGTLTRIDEYPWRANDSYIIDELCPWHQKYYTILPPLHKPYDGPVKHKLAIFKKN